MTFYCEICQLIKEFWIVRVIIVHCQVSNCDAAQKTHVFVVFFFRYIFDAFFENYYGFAWSWGTNVGVARLEILVTVDTKDACTRSLPNLWSQYFRGGNHDRKCLVATLHNYIWYVVRLNAKTVQGHIVGQSGP